MKFKEKEFILFGQKNDNSPVRSDPSYEMLIQFLQLYGKNMDGPRHNYPDYGTFICGEPSSAGCFKNKLFERN